MEYAYPDAVFTLTAVFTKDCSAYAVKNDSPFTNQAGMMQGTCSGIKSNSINNRSVGIKFDNSSAGKYFILIHRSQPNKGCGKKWKRLVTG